MIKQAKATIASLFKPCEFALTPVVGGETPGFFTDYRLYFGLKNKIFFFFLETAQTLPKLMAEERTRVPEP